MAGDATARAMTTLAHRSRASLRHQLTVRDRLHRVRVNLGLALQAGLAAGLSWYVAQNLVGHEAPFFAPIAAVITLAVSIGQRLRRALEMVVGVALGIAVGDVLVTIIGTGPIQIAVVVILAVVVAIFLRGGSALVVQAAASAVLVATLTPPGLESSLLRFVDALVGGGIGLAVMALLLPLNPLTVVSRATRPVLVLLADSLTETAAALATGQRERADRALTRVYAGEEDLIEFQEALAAGREHATLAPLWWRIRVALAMYVDASDHIAHALRNVRVLVRRSVRVISDDEPIPSGLAAAVARLAEAVNELRRELADAAEPERCRERALAAVSESAQAYGEGVGFSGGVVVAQVRTTATDLICASGIGYADAERLVRKASRRP